MAEKLKNVAQRMADQNLSIHGVLQVYESCVDFQTGIHGIEWSNTDMFGGWDVIAVEKKDARVYRVWFER